MSAPLPVGKLFAGGREGIPDGNERIFMPGMMLVIDRNHAPGRLEADAGMEDSRFIVVLMGALHHDMARSQVIAFLGLERQGTVANERVEIRGVREASKRDLQWMVHELSDGSRVSALAATR